MEPLGIDRHQIGIDRLRGEEGNTDFSPRANKTKQGNRYKYYCGTLFGYEEIGIENINRRLREICEKFQYGYETCPSTGRPHLQLFLSLKKQDRITALKIPGNPNLQKCNGSEAQNLTYTSKEGKVYRWGFPYEFKLAKPYKWQQDVIDICSTTPNDRHIYWFWDESGSKGKSMLIKHLGVNHGALFTSIGKHADIINLVFNADMESTRVVLFDLPRSNGPNVSYTAIEMIKNGMICNTKYETGTKFFDAPHIMVFANSPPDTTKLSMDRWIIREITDDDCVS